MGWLYRISTGDLFLDGALVGKGYSGHPPHVNDVSAQALANEGPIPEGEWRFVGTPYDSPNVGRFTLAIEPKPGTVTYGRSAFKMHGERVKGPPGLASHGCLIFSRAVRTMVAASGCSDLTVKA